MTIKKLSAEARAELGIEAMFARKLWAYVPVTTKHGWGLGIAVANESGYHPIPVHWCLAEWSKDAFEQIFTHAAELNRERGMSEHEWLSIEASSMAAQNRTYVRVTQEPVT